MRRILAGLILSVCTLSCGECATEPPAVMSVTVLPDQETLTAIDQTVQFQAKAFDADGILLLNEVFSWSSSDANVATVNQDGLATAKGNGRTNIIVETSGIAGTTVLIVNQRAVTVLTTPSEVTLTLLGETTQFSAEAWDTNDNAIVSAVFLWTSSDETVAGVNETGLATARWEGEATITVSIDGVSDTAHLTVEKLNLIAFIRYFDAGGAGGGGQTDIFLMRADGTNERNVTGGTRADEMHPDWSPDGSKLAFSSNETGKTNIYVINPDGSGKTNLTDDRFQSSHDPSWSPDGSKIVFYFIDNATSEDDNDAGIAVINSDGTNIIKILSIPCAGGCAVPFAPDWMPDGRIAFTAKHLDGNFEIYSMDSDGTNLTNLTNNPASDALSAESPDGSRIAFASNRDGKWNIHVMNADGSDVSTSLTPALSQSFEPSWSPDGGKIVFMVYPEDGLQDIYVMNADGTGHSNVTNTPNQSEFYPAWRQ